MKLRRGGIRQGRLRHLQPGERRILAVGTKAGRQPRSWSTPTPMAPGWLFRIKLDDAGELANLLDADGYQNVVDEEYAPGPANTAGPSCLTAILRPWRLQEWAQPLRLRDALPHSPSARGGHRT